MLNKYDQNSKIPSAEFALVHSDETIHDTKFETKAVGWLKDSMTRFAKNKLSVICAAILATIALFSVIVPIASPKNHVSKQDFPSGFRDSHFSEVLPKVKGFSGGFWDGTKVDTVAESDYLLYKYSDSNYEKYQKVISSKTSLIPVGGNIVKSTVYKVKIDTYAVGIDANTKLKLNEYNDLLEYENEKGISMKTDAVGNYHKSILKPLVDYQSYINGEFVTLLKEKGISDDAIPSMQSKLSDWYAQGSNASVYFKVFPKERNGQLVDNAFAPIINETTKTVEELYLKDSDGNYIYAKEESGEYRVRVDYYDYFTYKYGFEPIYVFGSNMFGQDILLRLARGTSFSLLLAIGCSVINFLIGLIWGAISGYYGGTADLVMERITDIISGIPTLVVMTIASIMLVNEVHSKFSVVLAFLIAFVYNGWVGVASTTRMQFYRFKGQEYVLASRTLGAKDSRLIFKHILPNAAGTLVTSCVLMIPSVIFSESSLSFLGIIDLATSGIDSVGVLLSEGQKVIQSSPHVLMFPVVLIAILMICFSLFGNGLRDAFNTTLRGSED